MQPLPAEAQLLGQGRVGAVGQVTDARVLQRGHVHADLVGAAGLELDVEQRRVPEGLDGVVVGDAVAASRHHRELVRRGGMPVDRGVDGAGHRVGMALHQCVVALVDGPLAERVLQHGVGPLALGDHHQPAGADVESVDDALPLLGAAGRHPVPGRGQPTDDGRVPPSPGWGGQRHRPACRPPRWRRPRRRCRAPRPARPAPPAPAPPTAGRPRAWNRPATRSDLPRTRPSTDAPPCSMIVTADVRDRPNSRDSAASRRSPSSPSGTGSERRSVTRSFCLGGGPTAAVELNTPHRQEYGESSADRDARCPPR